MKLYSEKQSCRLLRVEEMEPLLEKGIPHLKIGKHIRFVKKEIKDWYDHYAPNQRKLENAFIDSQGRTIDAYVLIDTLVSFLAIGKKKVNVLCEEGMPYQQIGTKRFFHLGDIVAHFKIDKKKEIKKIEKIEETLLIVDGSHNTRNGSCGTGVVVKQGEKVTGYANLHLVGTKNTLFSEYLAIREALKIAKEQKIPKIAIGTDQKLFISSWKDGNVVPHRWMKREPFAQTMNEIRQLIEEFGDNLSFVYANTKTYEKEYNNAHALSRYYKKQIVEIEQKELPIPKEIPKYHVTDAPIELLHIRFIEIRGGYCWFNVTANGKTKITKLNQTRPVKAALLIASSYVKTVKKKFTVIIDPFANFKHEMDVLFNKETSMKTVKTVKKLLIELENLSNFKMADNYLPYLQSA